MTECRQVTRLFELFTKVSLYLTGTLGSSPHMVKTHGMVRERRHTFPHYPTIPTFPGTESPLLDATKSPLLPELPLWGTPTLPDSILFPPCSGSAHKSEHFLRGPSFTPKQLITVEMDRMLHDAISIACIAMHWLRMPTNVCVAFSLSKYSLIYKSQPCRSMRAVSEV